MASLIDELIDVLDKEEKEYQDLILLSREKTPVIVKGDLDKLQKITEAEQFVVGKVNKLEKKRAEVVKDIAIVLGRDEDTLKVKEIADMKLPCALVVEGRIWEKEDLSKAFALGADAVVIGKAITNPMAITKYFLSGVPEELR